VRQAFQELVDLGPLPASDALDAQNAQQYEEAIKSLPSTPTAEEAIALVDLLPPDDSTAFGLAWSLLHAIEASAAWPLPEALDDRNVWVTRGTLAQTITLAPVLRVP
jgi:hypothetical protein